jgi:hypothetical protein
MGKPPSFQHSGMDIAELPVRLATTPAKRTVWPLISSDRHGSSGVECNVPMGGGGVDIVGVRRTSTVVKKSAITRLNRWMSSMVSSHSAAATQSGWPRSPSGVRGMYAMRCRPGSAPTSAPRIAPRRAAALP